MTPAADAERLRARARTIRRAATAIDDCAATRLTERAGDDVWAGPTAQHCLDDLQRIRATMHSVHDDMLAVARGLEHQAEMIATAALPKVPVS